MRTSLSNVLKFVILACLPLPVHAFDQNHFLLLLQEYQKHCSRMIASPEAFHLDPRSSFGIRGDEEFYYTEDYSNIDYHVEVLLPNLRVARSYGIVSIKVSNLIEQSCQILDYKTTSSSTDELTLLGSELWKIFETSAELSISGGKSGGGEISGYSFAVTGLFSGEDIVSEINFSGNELSIEHIHLSKMN